MVLIFVEVAALTITVASVDFGNTAFESAGQAIQHAEIFHHAEIDLTVFSAKNL